MTDFMVQLKQFIVQMSGLIPTIAVFFAALLLYVTYYTKQRFDSIKNKLFRYMLLFCLLLSITDVLAFVVLKLNLNENTIILTYKIDWFIGFVWYAFFYFYSMCFLINLEAKNLYSLIKENKNLRIFSIFFLASSIIYMFIPIVSLDSNNVTWLPKYISYYVISIVLLIVVIIIFSVLHFNKVGKKNKIILAIMTIESFLYVIIQYLFSNISFAPMFMVFHTYFLYFTVENPDLKVISEVEALKNNIEKTSNAKTDFLSNMSHEIRNPMNAIVGLSDEIIKNDKYDKNDIKSDITSIYNAGNNLLDIINNILDISKIEAGTEELYMKEYSLATIVLELSSIIEAKISNKNVKLFLDIDESTPSKLYGDQTKIYQILLNILTNAAKYTEVGKIKFIVNSEILNDYVILNFKISDTGYGIKKEDYDKLFEKFSRLDNATLNEIEGTGLGLVITKKYVDLMGGKIWIKSDYQVGTSFFVEIKQKIIDAKPIGDIRKPVINDVVNSNFIDCSKYSVLVVDDNKLNIKVAKKILEKYKFNIDTSESGNDCINMIKSGKHYDIIFLDHMMPDMDGIEVLHILKKMEDYDIPPVVALTANAITGMKEMYLKEGFDEYLSKPININELDKLINKYFNN